MNFVAQCQSKSKMEVSSDNAISRHVELRGSSENLRHMTPQPYCSINTSVTLTT